MQRYDSYKDSGIQWLGEIPSHWEVVRLKSIIMDSQSGLWGEDPKQDGSDTICLRVADFDYNNGYIKEDNLTYRHYGKEFNPTKQLKTRDLLLEKSGGGDLYPVGRVVRYNLSQNTATCSNFIQKLTPIDNVDSDFVYYLFRTMYHLKVNGLYYNQTTGIQNLKVKEYLAQTVFLPPLPEQQAIASYLDTATAKIDEAIAQQQKMIDLLNERKQIIINNAVTKGLNPNAKMKPSGIDWIGNIPEHWDTIKIKYLLTEIKDRSATGQEEPLSMSQKYGLIPTKKMDVVPNMASSFVGAKKVGQGDLVFNKLKAHLGVFATSDYEGLVSPDYAVYKGTGLANLKYLEYIFKTPKCIAEFVRLITGVGSGLSRLYTSDLYSIYVPLPSMQEQLMIVEYIDSSTANIKTAITNAEKQITLLQERKQIIINDLVTGKVKVL